MTDLPFSESRARRRDAVRATRLYVLATAAACRRPWRDAVDRALRGGARMVQLREKHLADEELLRRAVELRRVCDDHGALLVVNDHAHVARDAGADGVHLGQDDVSVAAARALLGPDVLIGVSTHDPAELDRALRDGADLVGVGSVYATPTKGRHVTVSGPDALAPLAERAEAAGTPAFGIGGIDATRIAEVADAGFRRVAVCAGVLATDDPERSARRIVDALTPRA